MVLLAPVIQNVSENFAYLMGGHVFVSGSEYTPSGKRISVIRDDSVIMKALEDSGQKWATHCKNQPGDCLPYL
jgi:hypothetical protein